MATSPPTALGDSALIQARICERMGAKPDMIFAHKIWKKKKKE